MVQTHVDYIGELRCKATHGPSQSVIETDAPADNHGKAERFSPTDLLGAALASCMATVMGIAAQKRDWNLDGLSVDIEKIMTTAAPRRIAEFKVHVHMPKGLDGAALDELKRVAMNCPVHFSLNPAIHTRIVFQ